MPSIVLGTEDTTTNKMSKLCVSLEFTYNVTMTPEQFYWQAEASGKDSHLHLLLRSLMQWNGKKKKDMNWVPAHSQLPA